MFFHLYRYRAMSLLRTKMIIFWSFIFPIILGTLFYFAFGSSIGKTSSFETIKVAVVKDDPSPLYADITDVMKDTEFDSGDPMFAVNECEEASAQELLEKGEVTGILYVSDSLRIDVKSSAIYENILKQFADTYTRIIAVYGDAAQINPAMMAELPAILESGSALTKSVSLGGEKVDGEAQYFYALIAMACMYGSFIGVTIGGDIQANDSPLGARKAVSSVNRLTLVVADMLAAVSISFVEIMIVYFYLNVILGIPFGSKPLLVALTCLLGAMIGITIGQCISCVAKGKDGLKIALSLSFSMFSCFLSGLMFADMKNIIEQNIPILNKINPGALISDALYSITIYSDYKRYTVNIIILAAEAFVLTLTSFLAVRRTKHASI